MPGILDLMNHVQHQGEIGAQRAKTSRLGQLMAQGYQQGGDRSQLLGQIAQVDPNAAPVAQKAFGADDDAKMERVGQMASMLLAMPAESRMQAYPGMVAQLHQMGLGEGLQPNWSEDLLPTVQQIAQQLGSHGTGGNVQSTFIDAQGNRVAIMRDGSTQVLGQNAPNNQIIDTGNGFFGVNKGNLQAAPVMMGGQAPQPPPQSYAPAPEITMQTLPGVDVPPGDEVAMLAAAQNEGQAYVPQANGGALPQGAPMGGQQLRSAPKEPPPITPFQQAQLSMQQQRLEASQQAAQRAAEAAQAAQAAKQQVAAGKAQKARVAAQDSVDAYTDAIQTIDAMRSHPGYADLGTPMGDIATNVPVIRTDAKGANASLETLKSQIMINTLSKLKALSATGAAGFGALNQSEGDALRRAIANLDTAQSHADLDRAVLRVREVMRRSAQRIAEAAGGLGQDAQQPAAPQSGGVDDLLSKYGVK